MRAILRFIRRVFGGTLASVEQKGKAFARVAQHRDALLVARGKVIAIKAAHVMQHEALDELEAAASSLHASADGLESRLSRIAETL